jgi:chemotaxis response regulator CheB
LIHAETGLCLAQHPETAEFDGMPSNAIAVGGDGIDGRVTR